ncbi:UDP-N-acetylglucosamine--undecaprenyl-phosphate N-acetylglucosaminephosphotransferase [Photobacterium sp. J15]|uniref:UDP-N-acetylglucosamine--undecaprenyl-phosphate N-acetylglucosaminephosphotransferase n=1 Tax=Photobacterium sp. J15 TaxID=265901 RepID=UPI0007E4A4F2|nr:UDP-N-acetylglucosamine--undecaprenyl-phosphate N-acetylglucosaminephosphotransferase [Photobacterium sp. J15]
MLADCFFVFFSSFTALLLLRKLAKRIGLVDVPCSRKQHQGAIPLVGGLAVCFSIVQFFYYNPEWIRHSNFYILSIAVLTVVGAVDDKFDVDFKLRILLQGGLSVCMMALVGLELQSLGDLLGLGAIKLGFWGYLITILAVIGAINAFNMVDGIDGLLGGLSIVTFGSLALILYSQGQENLAYALVIIIVAIIPYVLLNLGILGEKRKVFMGDAGSTLIGFTVIWMLLLASQDGAKAPLRPVTALWLIAIPLMDMVTIISRRLYRGVSPFKPDREHLHHTIQRLGLNPKQTLLVICFFASLCAAFGIFAEIKQIPEYIMFSLFILCFFIYNFVATKLTISSKHMTFD